MEIITYSLRGGSALSDKYYSDVATFAAAVVKEGESRCSGLVTNLLAFLRRTKRESQRSRAEYVYELLTLGVLWHCHAADAQSLAALPGQGLTRLAELRERHARLKPVADWMRGILGTLFLQSGSAAPQIQHDLTLDTLNALLTWLAATGIFNEEVERLTNWRDCWAELPPQEVSMKVSTVLAFATWFRDRSVQVLGSYTPNVERFLADVHPHYRWRADALFCGRERVEYHLAMVGTEILNCTFRETFLKTARKIVLLPPCMCYQREGKCQARPSAYGAQCAHCTPQCRVHQVTRLGEKYGFPVFILPDELRVFSAARSDKSSDVGIVGVSCVLTNAPGGWETKRLGVPAQGVLLDYCGCRWHWHKEGIPTDINLNQLIRVLDVPQEQVRLSSH